LTVGKIKAKNQKRSYLLMMRCVCGGVCVTGNSRNRVFPRIPG